MHEHGALPHASGTGPATSMPGMAASADAVATLFLSHEAFEALVIEQLDLLPDAMVADLDNLVFVVEDHPEDPEEELLGVYDGIALTERDRYGFGELPDRIVLYRAPLLRICADLERLRHEVHVTLVHEIAHYYGMTEAQIHELGWG